MKIQEGGSKTEGRTIEERREERKMSNGREKA